MNDEILNNNIRRFLKKVGIHSHQAIEQAIHDGLAQGKLNGMQHLKARMQLNIEELDLVLNIDGDIAVD